jgi:hypothetical protein
MLKTRGGGGRHQHRDVKKLRRFYQRILGLETRNIREEIMKQLQEKMRREELKIPYTRAKSLADVDFATELNLEKFTLAKT